MENENIIQPRVESTPEPQPQSLPSEVSDTGLPLKNVEFMDYLGLKSQAFVDEVQDKIAYLAENLPDLNALQEADLRTGNQPMQNRLDKLYHYVMLMNQEKELKIKQSLVEGAKKRYE
jgi:hypothetical protein